MSVLKSWNGTAWEKIQDNIGVRSFNGRTGPVTLQSGDINSALGYVPLQSETDPTVPSWAKQQSKPTYQANEIVMGDSTVGAEISELSEDIVGKLSEPSSGLAVGKYFRIASIDASGHAVLEACDAPATDVQINGTSITQDGVANIPVANDANHGVLKLSSDYNLTITSAGVLRSTTCTTDQYQGRDNYSVISKGTLENIKTDLVGRALADTSATAYTAEQQAAARSRMGYPRYEKLADVTTTEEVSAIGIDCDFEGYDEIIAHVFVPIQNTGSANIYCFAVNNNGAVLSYDSCNSGQCVHEVLTLKRCIHNEESRNMKWIGYTQVSVAGASTWSSMKSFNRAALQGVYSPMLSNTFSSLKFVSNTSGKMLPVGTYLEVWYAR